MSSQRPDIEACITRLLAVRDHSTGELRAKLKKRQFDGELCDIVIADYVAAGWVNDEKFARHQAEVLADQGWGPMQIRLKLTNHGVSSDLASSTLDEMGANWVANARARLDRKYGEMGDGDRERAFRHLTYRGFSPHTARRAIFDDPEDFVGE